MCGRYTLISSERELVEVFDIAPGAHQVALPPRFNIAPSQDVPVIRIIKQGVGRELHLVRWGLVPSWARDPMVGNRMINARSETAAQKPSFRAALRARRCLIPCTGFYEWQPVASRGGARAQRKQPYYICRLDGGLLPLAGLWERWQSSVGEVIESCTILTTEANALLRPLHDRMPVILPPEHFALWLDPAEQDVRLLEPLLKPLPEVGLVAYPVGSQVGNPRNNDPSCIEPVG